MVEINFIQGGEDEKRVIATGGQTLMEAAIANGVDGIEAQCGGSCACGTCHIWIDPAWTAIVGQPSSDEADMLQELEDVDETSRLSCQIRITAAMNGLIVKTPKY